MSIKKLMIVSTGALVAGVILCSVPAAAHHSFAPYDDKNTVTVDGTLKEVRFANPHVGLVVDAIKDGKPVTYSIHGRSPGDWRREGWKPSDFKAGDKVHIIGFPRRDNELEVAIKTFTRASDGKYFGVPPATK